MRPRWRPDFSLGNLITIGTLAVGVIASWQSVSTKVASLERDVSILSGKLQDQQKEFQTDKLLNTRIMAEMQTDLRYMRGQLDRLVGTVQPPINPSDRTRMP